MNLIDLDKSQSHIQKYGTEKFNEYIARHGRSGDHIDLLTKLIAGSKDYGPLDDNEIVNEMTNLIFAGTDTTSNTFTYMFYELAKHPQWQKQLQAELDEAVLEEVPEYKYVMKLRVLDAVIHETLRFHPAAPASLQRLAPSEGGAVVDGIAIPQNVGLCVMDHLPISCSLFITGNCILPGLYNSERPNSISQPRKV